MVGFEDCQWYPPLPAARSRKYSGQSLSVASLRAWEWEGTMDSLGTFVRAGHLRGLRDPGGTSSRVRVCSGGSESPEAPYLGTPRPCLVGAGRGAGAATKESQRPAGSHPMELSSPATPGKPDPRPPRNLQSPHPSLPSLEPRITRGLSSPPEHRDCPPGASTLHQETAKTRSREWGGAPGWLSLPLPSTGLLPAAPAPLTSHLRTAASVPPQ